MEAREQKWKLWAVGGLSTHFQPSPAYHLHDKSVKAGLCETGLQPAWDATSYVRVPVNVPAILLPTQLSANVLRGSRWWSKFLGPLHPHGRPRCWVLGSWLQLGPILAVVCIWRETNRWKISLSRLTLLCPSLCHSAFKVYIFSNKEINKEYECLFSSQMILPRSRNPIWIKKKYLSDD